MIKRSGILGCASEAIGNTPLVALELLSGPLSGQAICIMICDSGLKYLSTDLWPDTGSA